VVLAFSPDGTQLISTGLDGRIRFSTIFLYDLVADKELWRKKQQHWFVNDLAFSPDGRTLALVGEIPAQGDQSGEVRLWDAASGEELRRYQGHRGQVSRVVFSPDGRTLATGSYDNTVRLWEVAGGGQRRRFIGHDYVILSISFSPDGRLLATAGGDFNVLIWDLTGRCRDGKYQRLRLSAAELRHCWDDLLDSDAAAAYRSIHALAASPQESVTFLQEHLRPVSAADPKRMASLLAALESDHFAERKQAGAELEKMAFAAEPALRQALQEKPSLESRRRIEQILRKLTNSHGLRARRVIEALELIATPEARRMLTALSGGHAAALPTREAKAALTRLKRRPNVKP
jgi:dipeptidyl aminopeptidase/acylaminoacyl peptidase